MEMFEYIEMNQMLFVKGYLLITLLVLAFDVLTQNLIGARYADGSTIQKIILLILLILFVAFLGMHLILSIVLLLTFKLIYFILVFLVLAFVGQELGKSQG